MSKKGIQTEEDLFVKNMPTIEPDGQLNTASSSVEVKEETNQFIAYFQENPAIAYPILGTLAVIFIIVLCLLIKKLAKNSNPMLEYAKKQTKRAKKDQAYVSSTNKLETPDSLSECIRAFIERTK